MIQRRVPFAAFQKAVYRLLRETISARVYDDVPHGAEKPYVTLEHFTSKMGGSKLDSTSSVSLTIHIYSDYEGKSEVNRIIDEICTAYSCWELDLSMSSFRVVAQDVDFVEVLPEEVTGYHGVVTVTALIQDTSGGLI